MGQPTTHRSLTIYRLSILALVLLAGLFITLGLWQIQRGAEREQLASAMTAGRHQAPLLLEHQHDWEKAQTWQPVQLRGVWRNDLTVLVENRNYQGRPGYWVATPLLLNTPVDTKRAALVLRGWLPRSTEQAIKVPPAAEGTVWLDAEMWTHVPRLYELPGTKQARHGLPAQLPDNNAMPPVVQNLDVADMEQASGLLFHTSVLAQLNPAPPLLQDWPTPNLNYHQNRGYALQWFGFALIVVLACFRLLYRLRQVRRAPSYVHPSSIAYKDHSHGQS